MRKVRNLNKYILGTSKGDTSVAIVKVKTANGLQKKWKFLEKKLAYTISSVTRNFSKDISQGILEK